MTRIFRLKKIGYSGESKENFFLLFLLGIKGRRKYSSFAGRIDEKENKNRHNIHHLC
jgi:hypothetical protein